MPDILPLLLRLQTVLPKTTCRQLAHIVVAVLTMTGRITQKGISRWTDQGGSYRTLQRFFHTNIDWLAVNGCFFLHFIWDRKGVYLLAGDETVVSKSGPASRTSTRANATNRRYSRSRTRATSSTGSRKPIP